MNVGEIIDQFRRQSGDIEEEYLWNDDELMIYLNEAQDEAAKRSYLLKTSDLSFLETSSVATITVDGTSGIISQILIDNKNIIVNPINWTGNNSVTAQLIAQEINEQNYFTAIAVSNIVTLKPIEGSGSYYNNVYPIIVSDIEFTTATVFSGGIDGICRIQLLPNKREYKFSQKILQFENFYFGDMIRHVCLRN